MTTLFFIIGVLFLMHEIMVLARPVRRLRKLALIEQISKMRAQTKIKLPTGVAISILWVTLFDLAYLIWCVIGGLMATQWLPFLILLVLGILVNIIRRIFKIRKLSLTSVFITFFDAIISAGILSYIIINHFHGF